jgi:hypothetical protein
MTNVAWLGSTKIIVFFSKYKDLARGVIISMVLVPGPAISEKCGTVLYGMKKKCVSPLKAG